MDDRQPAIKEWIRLHHELVRLEVAFGRLAAKVAAGAADRTELERERHTLMVARERCNAAYQKAFPPKQ